MAKSKKKDKKIAGLDSVSAINALNIESQPSKLYFNQKDIIPWGIDNLYPTRILKAIKHSPTAFACRNKEHEFVVGNGFSNGDFVINRYGETLNDILRQSVFNGYSDLRCIVLHVNFNILGQVIEIFSTKPEYVRKASCLTKGFYNTWEENNYLNDDIELDLYGTKDPIEGIRNSYNEEGKRIEYKGQIVFDTFNNDIYSTAKIDSASISASFEKESQMFSYAAINNGFSAGGVLKMPVMGAGTKNDENKNTLQEKVNKMVGAKSANGVMAMEVLLDNDNKMPSGSMFESFTHASMDTLYLNQNEKAQSNILVAYGTPPVLASINNRGLFSKQEYMEAFDYKNSATEFDRQTVERSFHKIIENSVWAANKSEIVPLNIDKYDTRQPSF